ncbi:MAG TPA: hypothetical protein VMV74_00795 [Bacteroidales bacterium]|nr:hypothetical protein [Bacteroidales bacterium]
MKKTIIGFSALIVLAFFVIFTVNAQTKDPKDKKAKTEISKDCSKCPSAATCTMATGENPVPGVNAKNAEIKCDPAQCKEGKCDPAQCKEGKCDPAACKTNCANASSGMKCDPSACSHQAVAKK